MKNIRKFETTAEMDNAVLEDVRVSYVNENDKVYTTPENGGQGGDDYSTMYTTFEVLEDGTFSFTFINSNDVIQYSIDNGTTWLDLSRYRTSVNVVTGDRVMWKSNITPVTTGIGKFNSTNKFNVSGNIMSLLYGDDFNGQTSLEGKDCAFKEMFYNCSFLIDASNLILPATTLSDYCYQYMFNKCTNLTTAPELPATTLAYSCYYGMFAGCTSLTTAPELPVTTLANRCYENMFNGCTNLTMAPELPTTTLTNYCYSNMFYGCTSLTTAPKLPATTLADRCYYSMFYNCTSLTTAPELPASTLAEYCYSGMFYDCTSLNHITMLATDISANNCLYYWVNGVSSTGTFVKHPNMTSLPTGTSGIPNGWTVEDAVL